MKKYSLTLIFLFFIVNNNISGSETHNPWESDKWTDRVWKGSDIPQTIATIKITITGYSPHYFTGNNGLMATYTEYYNRGADTKIMALGLKDGIREVEISTECQLKQNAHYNPSQINNELNNYLEKKLPDTSFIEINKNDKIITIQNSITINIENNLIPCHITWAAYAKEFIDNKVAKEGYKEIVNLPFDKDAHCLDDVSDCSAPSSSTPSLFKTKKFIAGGTCFVVLMLFICYCLKNHIHLQSPFVYHP
jgi:hypothetical protein